MDDCSPLEELDRVPTLQSFSPSEDWHRRRRLASALRYPPLYRCYSTSVDPWSCPSPDSRTPRLRRISWSSFDDRPLVHPAVERCRQLDQFRSRSATAPHSNAESIDHVPDPHHSRPDREVGRHASAAACDEPDAIGHIRDQLRAMFQVADNRLALKLFGSRNALLKEKRRQKAVGNFVIHPCSNFR